VETAPPQVGKSDMTNTSSQRASTEKDQSTATSPTREPGAETANNARRKRAFMTFDDGTRG